MIIGNIIGSNIYNLLLILGFVSLFENFSYNKNILSGDVIFLVITVTFFSLLILKRINIGMKISIFCISFLLNLYDKALHNKFLKVLPVIHLINRQKFDAKVF